MWGTAIISFFTLKGFLLLFPILNRGMIRNYYENNGWKVTYGEESG